MWSSKSLPHFQIRAYLHCLCVLANFKLPGFLPMITFPDSSLLTAFLTKLSELSGVFWNCITSCGRTLVPWELKTTTEIVLVWILENNVLSKTRFQILSLFIQIIEITLSTKGYAYFLVFLLLLQSNLYSILLDTEMLCDPPVTSLSKDFKQTNEQLAGPSWNLPLQPVSLQNVGFQLWEHVEDYSFIKLYDAWISNQINRFSFWAVIFVLILPT